MSKLIELMERAGQQAPKPLGFAPAAELRDLAPQVVLLARLLPGDLKKDKSLAGASVDAFLVGPQSAEDPLLETAARSLGERPWGVRLVEFGAAQVKQLMERGCDFIVFESMKTEAAVLNKEDLGTIVTLSHDLGEEVVRSVCELPVDAVLFSPAQRILPLTVESLAHIQRVRGLTDKPMMVEAPDGLGESDLEALRNLGIAAVIVDVPPVKRAEKVKKAIKSLPRRTQRRAEREALAPHIGPASEGGMPEPGDDEDDDEDF